MPVQIGAKSHDFSDPTGLLFDCHRRIEMFLGSLQRLADVIDSPLTSEARSALENALHYFHDAAPKHTEDEEGVSATVGLVMAFRAFFSPQDNWSNGPFIVTLL